MTSKQPLKRDIETVIDRLLDFVRSSGKVRLSDTAKALALTPAQVEKLALLLEESGLLEINYGLTEVTLREKTFKPKENVETQAAQTAKKKYNEVIEKSKKLEFEVMTSENLLRFIEKDIEKRLFRAENLIKSLEQNDVFSASELDVIERELSLAFDQLSAFSNEIETLKKKQTQFTKLLNHFKKRLHVHATRKKTTAPRPSSILEKIKLLLNQLSKKLKPQTLQLLPKPKKQKTKSKKTKTRTKKTKTKVIPN